VKTGAVALTKADSYDEMPRACDAGREPSPVRFGWRTDRSFVVDDGDGARHVARCCRGWRAALARGHDVPVRLPIDRAFSVRGFGTVVT
jgi:hypothetical protein